MRRLRSTRAGAASFARNLVVLNYHSLVSRLCGEAGVPLWERRDGNDQQFWEV